MKDWTLDEAIAYYKEQDAAQNQQLLVELLREVQEHNNGVLSQVAVEEISLALGLKLSFLQAIIKRYPSLRTEVAPHLLEVCGGPNCAKNNSLALLKFIATEYGVSSGGISQKGRFAYKICGCMKMCGIGSNVKWDGIVYNQVDKDKLQAIIHNSK